MHIALQFALTADEYVQMMRYLINWRRYAWIIGLLSLFLVGQYFVIGWQALAYLGLLLIFLVFVYFLIQRNLRKTFELSPHLQTVLHYQFSDTGFQVRTEGAENDYTWDMFRLVREVPGWFLMQQNTGTYNYVPQRAFNSAAEIEQFRNFLRERELLA